MRATQAVTATGVEATPGGLILVFGSRRVLIAWEKCSPKLAAATETQRCTAELSPGGYGIHWALLDEDLSVGGLLRDSKHA